MESDSTEFRLWSHESHVSTENVFVRCVSAFGLDSSKYVLPPTLCRVACKTYRGIVSSMDLDSLKLKEWSHYFPGPKFLIFRIDNNGANRKALAHLICLLSGYLNIFICVVVCIAHVLSNSAKWGDISPPTCEILRLSHFLKCRPVSKLDHFVANMMCVDCVEERSFFFIGKSELLYSL